VECKLKYVNFKRVSDLRRAFRLAFRVTEISDDWYRSSMGVMVLNLGTSQSAGEIIGCTCERQGQLECADKKPRTAGNKSGCTNVKPWSASDKSGSTSNHSRAVCEKHHLLWERCWHAWKS